MYETFSRMLKLTNRDLIKTSLEDLASMYQSDEFKQDPRIFAAAFVKCYRFIKNANLNKSNYDDGKPFDINLSLIDDEDVVGVAMDKLDICLNNFVYGLNKHGKPTKQFLTYFLFNFKNGLITECKKLMTQKRRANLGAISYDVLTSDPMYREPFVFESKEDDERFLDVPDDATNGLQPIDLRYCHAVLNGLLPYSANRSEISRYLEIPNYMVKSMKLRLQKHFSQFFEPDALVF